MEARVKQEIVEPPVRRTRDHSRSWEPAPENVIELSDSDDDGGVSEKNSRDSSAGVDSASAKKQKVNGSTVELPSGFLDPIPPLPESSLLLPPVTPASGGACKQFWKAGDYEGVSSAPGGNWDSRTGGMDHVRVHPKFLHSNATSHKWVLGAFAELLDNALDEVCNGATYVNLDMLINKKDGSHMLLIEDNGGGMGPDKMRQCMSLGYSEKSKLANTIGQYGNGFKTSTMRLGADVIVFSRSCGKDGKSVTQSIGLLSYTFLRNTGKEDIVVPILDYERKRREWVKIMRSSADDWNINVDTIVSWSPYSSEAELLQQFNLMKDHGTRIVIYNLWDDDQGQLELDFKSDQHDIQIRGVNRDDKNIQMAKEYPNSRHFLTYRHSLRSYVSILYLRLPPNFRIIMRGKDVEHHNVVNDMMMTEEVTYRPLGANGVLRDTNMVAIVTIGFVKDATAHIDVQGFNVYHKNRLIKPFWRVWNAAGSDGRGVIGVLEANFVEPAHDKQGFERTTVLARLENKLVQMQKTYWSNYCHKIGYAPRRNKKQIGDGDRESSPDYTPSSSNAKKRKSPVDDDKFYSRLSHKQGEKEVGKYASVNEKFGNGHAYHTRGRASPEEPSSPSAEDTSDDSEQNNVARKRVKGGSRPTFKTPAKDRFETTDRLQRAVSARQQETTVDCDMIDVSPSNLEVLDQLKEDNRQLKERLKSKEDEILGGMLNDLQRERVRCKSLEIKLQEAESKIEELNKEQESLIDIFSEERDRRDIEEENLRKRLRDASNTIEELREKVRVLEQMKTPKRKR